MSSLDCCMITMIFYISDGNTKKSLSNNNLGLTLFKFSRDYRNSDS